MAFLELFGGAQLIKYSPDTAEVRTVIGLANRTFDEFATLFEAYKCTAEATKKPAVPGSPGALVDRWFHVKSADSQLTKFFHDEHPQYTATLAGRVFAMPRDIGEHFGSRVTGVFNPQDSGEHSFCIEAKDTGGMLIAELDAEVKDIHADGLLWIDAAAAHKTSASSAKFVTACTNWGNVVLNASKQYYIAAISVGVTGADTMRIGVIVPDGTTYSPMPIDPFVTLPAAANGRRLPEDSGQLSFVQGFDLFKTETELANRPKPNVSYAREDSLIAAVEFEGVDASGRLPADHRYRYTIRQSAYKVPSTRDRRIRVGRFWGALTWFRYYYAGFTLVQDMVDRALMAFAVNNGTDATAGADPFPEIYAQKMPAPWYKADIFSLILTAVAPLTMVLAWIFPFSMLIKELVLERESQLKQSLLMMGLRPVVYWAAKAIIAVTLFTITAVFVTSMLTGGGIFPNSDPFIIFLFVEGFAVSTVALAFAVSAFFAHARVAAACGSLAFIGMYMPYFYIASNDGQHETPGSLFRLCMMSPASFALGTIYISALEQEGEGVHWDNVGRGMGVCQDFSIRTVILSMYFDALLYLAIAWYAETVVPIGYGRKRHPLFFLSRSFWLPRSAPAVPTATDNAASGISVTGLSMHFDRAFWPCSRQDSTKVVALNDLALTMEESKITGLLGHNGAGKTTLISILSGLISPTAGSVTVNGVSAVTEVDQIRTQLGICPQHDTLFDLLTVDEHLWLVGCLHGLTPATIAARSAALLEDLHFTKSRSATAGTLSGGMKRKLSLMMAYLGEPKLVILDEPTAGMDPSTRRHAWDLVLSRRAGRTVVLTTHHMDEADLLSDSICILSEGRLCCEGRPLELKRRFGGNYTCSLQLDPISSDGDAIHRLISASVEGTTVKDATDSSLSIVLPGQQRSKFPHLFQLLQKESAALGILHTSISVCSLEQIFLNVLKKNEADRNRTTGPQLREGGVDEDEDTDDALLLVADRKRGTGREAAPGAGRKLVFLTGWPLVQSRAKGLLMKRWQNSLRDAKALLSQTLLPVAFVLLTMYCLARFGPDAPTPPIVLDTSLYGGCPLSSNEIPVYSVADLKLGNGELPAAGANDKIINLTTVSAFTSPQRSVGRPWCVGGMCSTPRNVTSYILQTTGGDDPRHGALTSAGRHHGRPRPVSAWFNSLDSHALPISLSLANNMLLKKAVGAHAQIQTVNHPTAGSTSMTLYYRFVLPIDETAVIMILISLSFIPASFAIFLVGERKANVKHLQIACGVTPLQFWGINFIWDMANYSLVALLVIIMFAWQGTEAYSGANLPMMSGLIILYGWAMIPLTYLSTFYFREPSTAYIALVLGNMAIGIVCILSVFQLRFMATRLGGEFVTLYDGTRTGFLVFPTYALGSGILATANNFYDQQYAAEIAKNKGDAVPAFVDPVVWDVAGRNLCVLFLQGCVCFGLTLLAEHRSRRQGSAARLKGANIAELGVGPVDGDVLDEQRRIDAEADDIVQVSRLGKIFYPARLHGCKVKRAAPKVAVEDLTFGVAAGECFGLLGVNGAGKTTTFRSLTGDLHMSSGDVHIGGHSIRTDLAATQNLCGYCPQYNGVLPRLTGRETLQLFGRLRGINADELDGLVQLALQNMQLIRHADQPTSGYSGGNRRKLSVAIAMLSSPPVMFLDEPTAGMDLLARRFLWGRIEESVRGGCAVILTSHSMDECQHLCGRLAIMVAGQFRCLGTCQHLVAKFGRGFTIVVNSAHGRAKDALRSIQAEFAQVAVKEAHAEHLQLTVPKAGITSLASAFEVLDRLQTAGLLEDYEIGETSLDEIFCDFAEADQQQLAGEDDRGSGIGAPLSSDLEMATFSTNVPALAKSRQSTLQRKASRVRDANIDSPCDGDDNDAALLLH